MHRRRKNIKKINILIILALVVLVSALWFIKSARLDDVAGPVSPFDSKSGSVEEVDGVKKYQSDRFRFSFETPSDFTIGEFDEAGGRIILVSSNAHSVQIFISEYSDPKEALTFDKIKKEVPDLKVKEPEVLPMTSGEEALTFIGEDAIFGTTREVWLVHKANLFQITTTVESQGVLAEILNSWELF